MESEVRRRLTPLVRGRNARQDRHAGAVHGALAAAVAGLLLVACYTSTDGPGGPDAEAETADDVAEVVEPEALCPADARGALEDEVRRVAAEVDPCRTLLVQYPSWSSRLLIESACSSPGLKYCDASLDALESVFERIREPFAGRDLPCLRYARVDVPGGDCAEIDALDAAVRAACPAAADGPCWHWSELQVVIDDSGTVADLWADAAGSCITTYPLDFACLRDALLGLRVPCLAGYGICTVPDTL